MYMHYSTFILLVKTYFHKIPFAPDRHAVPLSKFPDISAFHFTKPSQSKRNVNTDTVYTVIIR